ncbi:branched-chain amino acid ABC transporter permease [Paradesulfitobacterium ferrireducens]|uniref:branched-chain amino acid ABC transporter permease n=1 Tax=Paradesulfitobacterium ferrireducens TaxID=2816476 RepID=UPI001A8FF6E9|nr:branched-chain amino acid ABC transporter permease [Paradesulfitobacterium ferrireducens]
MPDVSLPTRMHKIRGLLSLPRSSRTVPILLLLILVAVPLITPSRSMLNLLTEIFIMGIFAMSYDILLGYTGIVSFGHALFFGTGAYMTGLIFARTGPKLGYLFLAIGGGILLVTVMALIIGYLSLRLKDVYYAMITLAFAELFFIIAEKWRSVTNGADGFSFNVPAVLQDRVVYYYVSLVLLALIVVFLRRFIESPTGKVLQAIRENEKRAEFLGYDVLKFKLISNVIAGVVASFAGVAWALQQRFVSTGVMTVDKTIDALLMTTIGGTGTLYGALLGSGITGMAKNWLSELAKVHPIFERWYIIFGLLYIGIVLFFPGGILGTLMRIRSTKNKPSVTISAGD